MAGNGIRSIGHFGVVILRDEYHKNGELLPWDVDEFSAQIVCSLSEKVDMVPALLDAEKRRGLSWKQRSIIKKHGRIACNSLALILKCWILRETWSDACLVALQKAVISVAKCVECLGSALDEKVLVASMQVLLSLSSSDLARISGKSGLVGNALVSCILFLAKVSRDLFR